MNDQPFDNPFILQASIVDNDDIDQEMALLKLEGITASRRIVSMKLMQKSEALFQGDPGAMASPIITRTLPPAEVVQMLISWATQQDNDIAQAILDFLVEPDEEELETLVKLLKRQGLAHKTKPAAKAVLSDTLTAYLSKRPRSKEELYDYTRTMHTANRPEAAVRQYLRRATRSGLLIETNGLYSVAKINKEQ